MDSPSLKICSQCHQAKPLDDFSSQKNAKDGKCPWCKACTKTYNASRLTQEKVVPEAKVCRQCQQLKPIAEFGIDKYTKDGYASRCLDCKREENVQRYLINPADGRARQARYRTRHPEKVRLYEEAHKDEKSERMRKRYAQKRNEILAQNKGWYEDRPGYSAERIQRRRQREAALPNTFTVEQRTFMFRYWQDTCVACGAVRGLFTLITADHWIPVIAPDCPGAVVTNMVPLCLSCNKSKGDSRPHTWLVRRFGSAEAARIEAAIAAYVTVVAHTLSAIDA